MKSLLRSLPSLLAASSLAAAGFTPDDAVSHAVAHQPELAAARMLVSEARARRKQGGRLSNPELESEVRPNTNGREGVAGFGLTQRFPLTARLRHERAALDADIAAAEAEVLLAERQLANRTALTVAEWLLVEARLELVGRQLANARELAATLQVAADKGEVSPLDSRQLAIEVGQTALRRRQLELDRVGLQGALRQLLHLAPDQPVTLAGTLPTAADLDAPGPAATPHPRPELRIASARLEIARHQERLARARRWQDVGVGLVSELQRSEDFPAGMQRDDFVGLRLSVPLPFWDRNQGRIEEGQALVERRRLELEAVGARIRNEQQTAQESLELARANEREWREQQVPMAREVEDQLFRLKAKGQVGFADWARARERRLQAEAAHLDSRSTLLRAWLESQAASGRWPLFPARP